MANKNKRYIDKAEYQNTRDFTFDKNGKVYITRTLFTELIKEQTINYIKLLDNLHFNKLSFFMDYDFIKSVYLREKEQFEGIDIYKISTSYWDGEIDKIIEDLVQEIKAYKLQSILQSPEVMKCVNKEQTHQQWINRND